MAIKKPQNNLETTPDYVAFTERLPVGEGSVQIGQSLFDDLGLKLRPDNLENQKHRLTEGLIGNVALSELVALDALRDALGNVKTAEGGYAWGRLRDARYGISKAIHEDPLAEDFYARQQELSGYAEVGYDRPKLYIGQDSEMAQNVLDNLRSYSKQLGGEGADNAFQSGDATQAKEPGSINNATHLEALDSKPFVDVYSEDLPTSVAELVIDANSGSSIDVPLGIVIAAKGFDSWRGRPDDPSSLSKIQNYAGLETDIPPISEAYIFIQPDGKIFAHNGSGDSHRIAAAVLRGDESIGASRAVVRVVDKNVI